MRYEWLQNQYKTQQYVLLSQETLLDYKVESYLEQFWSYAPEKKNNFANLFPQRQ